MKQKHNHNQFPVLPLVFLLLVATMTGILSDIYLVRFIGEEHIGITIGMILDILIIAIYLYWRSVYFLTKK
ncbi:MAG: hypothetical protein WC774_04725 [Candidatus Gracilibacteria bacterium]|jgi:hypothetical protein